MRRVEFEPFVLNNEVGIYSISLDGDKVSEMDKFICLYRDVGDKYLKHDYKEILKCLIQMSLNSIVKLLQNIDREIAQMERCGLCIENEICNLVLNIK